MVSSRPEIDPKAFRHVMGSFATGVTVITTEHDGEWHGMTANSLTSVSLDPLLMLVCFVRESRTAEAVQSSGRFAVNILSHDQMAISNAFARSGEDHFTDVSVGVSDHGLPLLRGALGFIECEVDAIHDGGDHIIVVGAVLACEARQGQPLVFLKGKYARTIDYDEFPVPNWWG